jgi:hypothetical protein
VGTNRAVPFTAVARASYAPAGPLSELGIGLEASGCAGDKLVQLVHRNK